MIGMRRSGQGQLDALARRGPCSARRRDGRRRRYRRAASRAASSRSRYSPEALGASRAVRFVADVVHRAGLVLVLDLVVGEGRAAGGAPVDQVLALVHEAPLVERDEDLAHRLGQALVEGEALAAPVAGGAYLLELLLDDVVVLVGDLPGLLDEFLAAELAAIDAPARAASSRRRAGWRCPRGRCRAPRASARRACGGSG